MCGGPVAPAGALYVDRWRAHPECTAQALTIVRGVLGSRHTRSVSERDAELMHAAGLLPDPYVFTIGDPATGVPRSPEAAPVDPWSWVTPRERADLARAVLDKLPELRRADGRAPNAPTWCTDGPCALCGRRLSTSWHTEGHRWAGSKDPAPVCGECYGPYMRAVGVTAHTGGGWTGWTDSRRGVVAAATGMSRDEPYPLPAWAEHHTRADAPPAEPWGHVDPDELERLRVSLWLSGPLANVPAHRRDEIRALRRGDLADVGRRLYAQPWNFTPRAAS